MAFHAQNPVSTPSRKGQPLLARMLERAIQFKLPVPERLRRMAPPLHNHASPRLLNAREGWSEPGDAAIACEFYAGRFVLAGALLNATPETVFSLPPPSLAWQQGMLELDWLRHFSTSAKRLHACYALRLVERWSAHPHKRQSLDRETLILARLAAHLPKLAILLQHDAQALLAQVLSRQVRRVQSLTPTTAHEGLSKGKTLLDAALVHSDGKHWQAEALALLDKALPHIVNSEGGPATGGLEVHVAWAENLLPLVADMHSHIASRLGQPTRAALDRFLPFLHMLKRADGSIAFAHSTEKLTRLLARDLAMRPLSAAPASGFARISHGKSCLIASAGKTTRTPLFDFSRNGHALLRFGMFESQGADASVPVPANWNIDTSHAGSLFDIERPLQKRSLFIAASGEDIRCEDCLPHATGKSWMLIQLEPGIKLSIARNSTSATLALPDRSTWQLSIRGARLIPHAQDHRFYVEHHHTQGARINWALKKVAKPAGARRDLETADLPF